MSFNYVALDSASKTFDAVFHDPDTANKRDADTTPVFNVFEDANDTPILLNQSMTKRTGFTGCYKATFAPSTANGFEVGKSYNVHVYGTVTGTVSGNSISDDWVAATFCIGVAETVSGSVPATVAGAVASVTGNVGGSVLGSVAGSVATVTDLSSTAQVELTSVPASTATIKDMIKWIYLGARNRRTQTATAQILKANDGSTTIGTSTVSDDTVTAVRGVWI